MSIWATLAGTALGLVIGGPLGALAGAAAGGAVDAMRARATNPERRRVYLQYCRMQKACTRLAKDFNGQEAGDAKHERKVIAFDPSGRSAWGPGILAAGGLMAAACVALVLVNRSSGPTPPAVAAPTARQGHEGPDAIHLEAQDRTIAAGRKLVDQEKWKREEHPFDAWPKLKAQAAADQFPKLPDKLR
jgi:hypothetical protein